MNQILILQLIAHFLADFFFQRNNWIKTKESKIFSGSHFYHISIVFIISCILSFQSSFILFSLLIAVSHFLTDAAKSYINIRFKKDIFFFDQVIHLTTILIVVGYLVPELMYNIPFDWEEKYLSVVLAYLLCLSPSNILIKKIFNLYSIRIPETGIPNAGKLIGNTERILTLTFMLTGNYEVVGFIIASKSILRFKETDTINSEYVLTGTLLSFGIAVLTGIVFRLIYIS